MKNNIVIFYDLKYFFKDKNFFKTKSTGFYSFIQQLKRGGINVCQIPVPCQALFQTFNHRIPNLILPTTLQEKQYYPNSIGSLEVTNHKYLSLCCRL